MMNDNEIRTRLAAMLLNLVPSRVRDRVLIDERSTGDIGIPARLWFPLNDQRVEMSSLNAALRSAADGRKTAVLTLAKNKKVRAQLGWHKPGTATIKIGKSSFSFSDVDLLSTKRSVRLSGLKRVFGVCPLLQQEEEKWRKIAEIREFADVEGIELMTALGMTPEGIRESLSKPQNLSFDTLVPDDRYYYQRLLGERKRSRKNNYADELADSRKEIIKNHPDRAYRRIAYSGVWRPLIPFDALRSLKSTDLTKLLRAEDPFSLLFGFELAVVRLKSDKGYEQIGRRFLEKMFSDDEQARYRCVLFSACAIVSTVKLRHIFSDSDLPLVWFRTYALSHSGVLVDALHGIPEPEKFLKWVIDYCGSAFLWQASIDRREAPRWSPEWISPENIEAELIGRALIAMSTLPKGKRPKSWVKIIDRVMTRLTVNKQALSPFFAGPLDDFLPRPHKVHPAFLEVEEALKSADELSTVPGFVALVFAGSPSEEAAIEVARLLEVSEASPHDNDASLLGVCAHMAAIVRSEKLADTVITYCVRRAGRSSSDQEVIDLFRTIINACAAWRDQSKYRLKVGESAVRLTYALAEARMLIISKVFAELFKRDPKLIPALSRAVAIVDAVILGR
jgi:hypothetical protein